MFSDSFHRFRALFRRAVVESELETELDFHRERQLEKYLRAGLTRDEALRRLRLDFGGLQQVKEECRDARGTSLLDDLAKDLRYGWRTLFRSPGFAAAALLSLALGIGANTAIFSVVYAILLRPLPFRDPSRLVVLHETTPRVGKVSVSYPNFQDWRSQSKTFSAMAIVNNVAFNMSGAGQPENLTGLAVSPDFLPLAGIRPVLGRAFMPAEEKPGTAPVVLLSYALWQSHFGGSSRVLGETIRLDQRGFVIVGVLPARFRWISTCDFMEPVGVWATGNNSVSARERRGENDVVGRLAEHVTFAQARAEMDSIAARLAAAYPAANDEFGVDLEPLRDSFSGNIRPAILVLLAGAIFVLLVACANVANLFLMRGAFRAREIALRVAIGANRARIVRQLLTESFLIALLGGLAGIALAVAGIPFIARLIPQDALASARIQINGMVLLFSAGLVFIATLLFGLFPALHSARADVHSDLKQGGRASHTGAQNRWRAILAAVEVAITLILLVGAGLMMKSFYRLLSDDAGFRAENVLKLNMSLRTARYDRDDAVTAFWQETIDRVRALPGVAIAAAGTAVPLSGDHSRTDITAEGMPLPRPGSFPHPDIHIVSSDYERALGVRLLRGRAFTAADRENAPPVAMINASVAARLFPNVDPVGKRIVFGHGPGEGRQWISIVGVLADTKLYGLGNPSRLEVYLPFRQSPSNDMSLLIQSRIPPADLTSAVRAVVASIDREQPVFAVLTMQDLVNASIFTRRVTLIVLGLFSALALVLAAIGVYGVVSWSIVQQTKEIGVRLALGASREHVLRLALSQGAMIATAGILAGTAGSLGLTRWIGGLLYLVNAIDPITFATVAAALAVVAMAACYIPARRALSVDPLTALRHE